MSDWQPSPVLLDEDLDRPYEPWQPEIGQRVRVRLSGECNVRGYVEMQGGAPIRRTGHPEGLDGRHGEVRRCHHPNNTDWQGHYWCVEVTLNGWTGRAHFAAIELEPIEEVPTAEQPAVASGA